MLEILRGTAGAQIIHSISETLWTMGCKRQLLMSRLLLVVVLSVLCFDGGRLSERMPQPNSGRKLIDMSIEELMDLRVTCNFDKGAQRLVDSIPKSKS